MLTGHIPKTTVGTKYQRYVTMRTKNQDTTHQLIQEERDQLQEAVRRDDKPG